MPADVKTRIRRRHYLPSSPQGTLLQRVYWMIFLSLAVQSTLVYLIANRQLETEYFRAHQTIASTLEGLVPWIIGASLISLLAALFGTLRLTLSVAGPTQRLQKCLRLMSDGDLTQQLRFRRGDALQEVATEINKLAARLESHVSLMQASAGRLRHIAGEFDEGQALSGKEIASLHGEIMRIEKVLSDFHTTRESGI